MTSRGNTLESILHSVGLSCKRALVSTVLSLGVFYSYLPDAESEIRATIKVPAQESVMFSYNPNPYMYGHSILFTGIDNIEYALNEISILPETAQRLFAPVKASPVSGFDEPELGGSVFRSGAYQQAPLPPQNLIDDNPASAPFNYNLPVFQPDYLVPTIYFPASGPMPMLLMNQLESEQPSYTAEHNEAKKTFSSIVEIGGIEAVSGFRGYIVEEEEKKELTQEQMMMLEEMDEENDIQRRVIFNPAQVIGITAVPMVGAGSGMLVR